MDKETMRKVYMDAQATCGLAVGDFVRVIRKAEEGDGGWNGYWIEGKDECIGKVGVVSALLCNALGIGVEFSDGGWKFPYFVLEKVPYIEMHEASGLKAGDKVKITRKAKDFEGGWRADWRSAMDKYIGKIGTIYHDDKGGGFCVTFNEEIWNFPCFILEKVEEEPEVTTPKDIQQEILESIKASLHHSREKHPVFANSKEHAVSLLTEEVGEVAMAVNDNDKEATKKELLDVIAVCLRWMEGDIINVVR